MKKIIILCTVMLLFVLGVITIFGISKDTGGNTMDGNKEWFVIEDITYDQELHKISGNCIEGVYLGEVEIYLPDFIDTKELVDGMTIKAYCGPGMTMSLPPQLMGCSAIEIINMDETEYSLKVEGIMEIIEE